MTGEVRTMVVENIALEIEELVLKESVEAMVTSTEESPMVTFTSVGLDLVVV